jgi:hypothetical protein
VPPERVVEIATPHGTARAHVRAARGSSAALVLGHGAGGGVSAPDLAAACRAALERGLAVALVEQPYRVAGRRSPAPAQQLDTAWEAVVAHLREHELAGRPLVAGGRSSGARVACRTARATGATAVLCLAFPLHPPGRPAVSRLAELDAAGVPTLVVQGERDAFGRPPEGPHRSVVVVRGDHALKADPAAVEQAVGAWLREVAR